MAGQVRVEGPGARPGSHTPRRPSGRSVCQEPGPREEVLGSVCPAIPCGPSCLCRAPSAPGVCARPPDAGGRASGPLASGLKTGPAGRLSSLVPWLCFLARLSGMNAGWFPGTREKPGRGSSSESSPRSDVGEPERPPPGRRRR